jgi:glyoxylase-like metal-dependent hydrolase (beta-lactamase superfamily II)
VKRRHVLKLAVASAAGLAFAPRAFADDANVERLADDLYVIRIPGEAAVVAQTGADGVLLVDGASAAASGALMKAVASLSGGGPVRTLFNTHWHPEQTGSNETLGTAGATIIAHENTRLWTTTDVTWPWNGKKFAKLPKVAQPNKTFYAKAELNGGIRYGYIPDCAHTDGDGYVHFTRQNVLAVGDAVCNAGWPVVDYETGGWIGGMVGGLQRLLAIADESTRIVPARGPVMTKAELGAQLKMYATINERLVSLLNHGKSPSEAVDAKPTKEFDGKMGNPDEFVRRAFESQWGYLSPDA